ncbi:unnamed protein product [Trichobilharzia szidati]|nr:unnamed protein product [Trichobilharzia szidati]
MGFNKIGNSCQIRLLVYYSCQLFILYNTWILKLIQSTNITNDHNTSIRLLHSPLISRLRRQILESSGKTPEAAALKATIATMEGSELTQISYHCLVYDETPANRILLDEITTNTCQLLSRQQIIQLKLQKIQLFNIKVITTANPLAKYLKIDTNNYTLMTVQHVDREELCSSNSVTDTQLTTSLDSLRVCCINRMKECIFPLNILVQTGVSKEDITGIIGTDTTLSNTTSTTSSRV